MNHQVQKSKEKASGFFNVCEISLVRYFSNNIFTLSPDW